MGNLSQRVQKVAPSATLVAAAKARALAEQGVKVLNLTVGEPDFPTPTYIQAAAIEAIQSGKASYYTAADGIPELKAAILAATAQDYGLHYEKNQVLVTNGAKFALYAFFQAVLDEEDEVIIPTPYWVSYSDQVLLADGKPVLVPAAEANGFKITVAELEAARTPKTKVLLLNSPSNPTGAIYSAAELRAIGEWAVAHDLLILADDIYAKLVYNQAEVAYIANLSEEIQARTTIINGVSKTYAMTGWRIGYALGDPAIIKEMAKVASQATSNPTAVSQYAAVAALSGGEEAIAAMHDAFEHRLNQLYPQIAALPGFRLAKPEGAFYFFPNVVEALQQCGFATVDAFVEALLEEEHVAVVAGTGFGAPEYLRISYATDLDTLEKAVNRIAAFIERHSKIKSVNGEK